MEERTQVGDVEKLAGGERARPTGLLGSQGRLSTPAELMVWFTTPVLNGTKSLRTVQCGKTSIWRRR